MTLDNENRKNMLCIGKKIVYLVAGQNYHSSHSLRKPGLNWGLHLSKRHRSPTRTVRV